MDQEAVNTSVDTEVASPASESVTPDYNSFDYDESQEVALPEEAEPEAGEVEEPAEQDEAPKDSPRYEKRIRQLSATVKELKTQQAAPAAPAPITPQPQAQPEASVSPRELPPGDYSPEEIKAWVTAEAVRTGQALSSIEVNQLRAELAQEREVAAVQTSYSNDLHTVETKYPELNEDSPQFDPHLAQVVTEIFEESLLASPKTASLAKVADRIMSINQRTASKSAAAAAKSVATQRSAGAPSPSGQGPKSSSSKWTEEAVANLSLEEYEANESAIKRDLLGS